MGTRDQLPVNEAEAAVGNHLSGIGFPFQAGEAAS
jgi:hypothetical protein